MPKPTSDRSPSRQEFLQTIESEFSFLVEEDGYSRGVTDEYSVEYAKGAYRLQINGASYGFAIDMTFFIDGKYCPVWGLVPECRTTRKTARTDTPQLDEIRERAWWFKNGLRGLIRGEPEFVEKTKALLVEQKRQEESRTRVRLEDKQGLFFSLADKLFKAREYAECVRHLESGQYPLTKSWNARLEYARKHS